MVCIFVQPYHKQVVRLRTERERTHVFGEILDLGEVSQRIGYRVDLQRGDAQKQHQRDTCRRHHDPAQSEPKRCPRRRRFRLGALDALFDLAPVKFSALRDGDLRFVFPQRTGRSLQFGKKLPRLGVSLDGRRDFARFAFIQFAVEGGL